MAKVAAREEEFVAAIAGLKANSPWMPCRAYLHAMGAVTDGRADGRVGFDWTERCTTDGMDGHISASIHTYARTYIRTYVRTYIHTYYLHPKTEVRGALHSGAIWELHYESC